MNAWIWLSLNAHYKTSELPRAKTSQKLRQAAMTEVIESRNSKYSMLGI